MILNQLMEILSKVQQSKGFDRVNKIQEFQEIVWDDETIEDEALYDILSTLAYDLDYYEPDEKLRKEDLSYYGDERLEEEIKAGLIKLEEYKEKLDLEELI